MQSRAGTLLQTNFRYDSNSVDLFRGRRMHHSYGDMTNILAITRVHCEFISSDQNNTNLCCPQSLYYIIEPKSSMIGAVLPAMR